MPTGPAAMASSSSAVRTNVTIRTSCCDRAPTVNLTTADESPCQSVKCASASTLLLSQMGNLTLEPLTRHCQPDGVGLSTSRHSDACGVQLTTPQSRSQPVNSTNRHAVNLTASYGTVNLSAVDLTPKAVNLTYPTLPTPSATLLVWLSSMSAFPKTLHVHVGLSE